MTHNDNQFSLDMGESITPLDDIKIYKDLIVDRGSRYTVVVWKISEKWDIKKFIKNLVQDSYFRKATHNSYSYRFKDTNNLIVEWKNDDGEQWAGMCILRELKRAEFVGWIVIVTRYFWWVQLHSDRFKNVIQATQQVMETLKKES